MKIKTTFFLAFLLIIFATLTFATRPEPLESSQEKSHHKKKDDIKKNNDKGGGDDGGLGGSFGPGGGYAGRGNSLAPTTVCNEKGPCYKMMLTCPAKCLPSHSRSNKGYGGGGKCRIDCMERCVAYCS